MSRNGLKFFLALSVLLNLSMLAAAGYKYLSQRHSWTSPFGTRMPSDRFLFEELVLSPAQTKTMREKAIPFRAEIDRQRTGIIARRKALIELLRSDHPDKEAIDAMIAQISTMQQSMQQAIARQMLDQKALLNPEQQKAFFDLIESAMTRGGETGCTPAGHE